MGQATLLSQLLHELFRPRRVRFSIRALLLFVTLVCVVLGAVIHPRLRRQRAVDALKSIGCTLHFDYEFENGVYKYDKSSPVAKHWLALVGPAFFHEVIELQIQTGRSHTVARACLAQHLPALTGLRTLQLDSGVSVNDDVLAAIGQLRQLQSLRARDSFVTDRGIARLAPLRELQHLALGGGRLTDQSLRTCGGLPQLTTLSLRRGTFTSTGLAHLNRLDKLETLELDTVAPFSAECLSHLQALRSLRSLNLPHVPLGNAQIQTLRSANPSLRFISGERLYVPEPPRLRTSLPHPLRPPIPVPHRVLPPGIVRTYVTNPFVTIMNTSSSDGSFSEKLRTPHLL